MIEFHPFHLYNYHVCNNWNKWIIMTLFLSWHTAPKCDCYNQWINQTIDKQLLSQCTIQSGGLGRWLYKETELVCACMMTWLGALISVIICYGKWILSDRQGHSTITSLGVAMRGIPPINNSCGVKKTLCARCKSRGWFVGALDCNQ